jgi:hypothetical protein
MALPKSQWAKKDPAPPILPNHRADFSDLEDLFEMVAGPDEFSIIAGEYARDEFPKPHVTIFCRGDNRPSYQFIKTDKPHVYTLCVLTHD